jgi:hypothetical protein
MVFQLLLAICWRTVFASSERFAALNFKALRGSAEPRLPIAKMRVGSISPNSAIAKMISMSDSPLFVSVF